VHGVRARARRERRTARRADVRPDDDGVRRHRCRKAINASWI